MINRRTDFTAYVAVAALIYTAHVTLGGAQEQATKTNWMFEYVELRTSAMTLRSVDPRGRSADVQWSIFQPRIVGGTIATPTDNPFQVALLKKNEPNTFQAQFCGGTLIKPNVVVTAAHCSDFVSAGIVQVLTGTQKLNGTGTRRNVATIIIHPNWNPTTFNNDVAIWKLSSSATGPFATLASSEGAVGEPLLATGWGAIQEGGAFPIDLMKVSVQLVASSNCNDANSYNGAITSAMLCAGPESGGKDTCQGDSGGPLTGGTANGVLTGITSWGRGCARPNFFGVYTKVSNSGIRSFIERNSQ